MRRIVTIKGAHLTDLQQMSDEQLATADELIWETINSIRANPMRFDNAARMILKLTSEKTRIRIETRMRAARAQQAMARYNPSLQSKGDRA